MTLTFDPLPDRARGNARPPRLHRATTERESITGCRACPEQSRRRSPLPTVVIPPCHNTQHDHFTHSHLALPRAIRPSPTCFPSFTKHLGRGNGGERTCQPKSPSHFQFRTVFVFRRRRHSARGRWFSPESVRRGRDDPAIAAR